MTQSVNEQINIEEVRLYEAIRQRVLNSIYKFCQWQLTKYVFSVVEQRESDVIKKYQMEVFEKLKEISPLHASFIWKGRAPFGPLGTVFNGCSWFYDQREYEKDAVSSNRSKVCFWTSITYKEFEDMGYSTQFVKRVTQKMVDIGLLKRKRGLGANSWSISNLGEIVHMLKRTDEAFQIDQFDFKRIEMFDWLFYEVSDQEKSDYFKKILHYVVNSITEGMSWIDSVPES